MFKREKVYATLGFQETYFEDTMKHTEKFFPKLIYLMPRLMKKSY